MSKRRTRKQGSLCKQSVEIVMSYRLKQDPLFFDVTLVKKLSFKLAHFLLAASKRVSLAFEKEVDWSVSSQSISRYFGLSRSCHSFSCQPELGYRLLERQATQGFVFYLNQGTPSTRRGRISAFIEASGKSARLPLETKSIATSPEYLAYAEHGRIDLFVAGFDLRCEGNICVIVEAKFGHKITKKQLPNARKHAMKSEDLNYPAATQIPLIIGNTLRRADTIAMNRQKLNDWRFVSWHDFLRLYEKFLPENLDDIAFASFRRTIWHRAED